MDQFTLLENQPLNQPLYSPEYLEFIRRYYQATIYFLSRSKRPEPVLPIASYHQNGLLTIGTLPKTDAPLWPLGEAGWDLNQVTAWLRQRFPDHQVLDLRVCSPDGQPLPTGFKILPLKHAVATFENPDLLSQLDKKTRNQTRRALEAGFEFKTEPDFEAIYRLYLANMRRHGTPPRALKYFQDLAQYLKDKVVFASAWQGKQLAGINVFYQHGNYLLLFHNLSDPRFWPSRVNNFLYYKTIEFGLARGVEYFDYGPSTEGDFSHLSFKIDFGGKLLPVGQYLWYRHSRDRLISTFRHHWRNLKMRFARLFHGHS